MSSPWGPRFVVIANQGATEPADAYLARLPRLAASVAAVPGTLLELRLLKELPHVFRRALLERALRVLDADPREPPSHLILNVSAEEAPSWPQATCHLPERFLKAPRGPRPETPFGVSVHDASAAVAATECGASWLRFGPIHAPSTKPLPGVGFAALRAVVAATPLPVLAVGGLTPADAPALRAAGAAGAAMVRVIAEADDPVGVLSAFRDAWNAPA